MRITESQLRNVIRKQLISILKEQSYQSQPSGDLDRYGRPLSRMGGLTTDKPDEERELQMQKKQVSGNEAQQKLKNSYKVETVRNALDKLNSIMIASGPEKVILQDALNFLELLRTAIKSDVALPFGNNPNSAGKVPSYAEVPKQK